eukprot:TRINITY_DN1909_c0_g1_i7.p3 TRINITY_DN1909_c0_g1~~TRINITY_DN1909_c0_g1_i7.p3  ORF type:complete len:199 (-),score=90.23 TRINITY_DN1909_c0_g1_i7:233-829(-)
MYGGANPAMAGNANLQQFMRLQQQQQQQQMAMMQQQQHMMQQQAYMTQMGGQNMYATQMGGQMGGGQMGGQMGQMGQMGGPMNMQAYQSVAGGYGNMALVPVQQQQGGGMGMTMGGAAGMNPMAMAHAARFGGNPNQYMGGGMQAAAAPSVPAMAAEGPSSGGAAYRVQRGTKPTRVNADDLAFGPLIESLKKSSVSK